jgi:thiol:disulfide interchange protein
LASASALGSPPPSDSAAGHSGDSSHQARKVAPAPPSEPEEEIAWVPYTDDVFERARKADRPLLLVICADWAAPCVRLARDIWPNERVKTMARAFVAVKVDVTDTSPEKDRLMSKLAIARMPAIVLLDPARGGTRMDLGYLQADEMAAALAKFGEQR